MSRHKAKATDELEDTQEQPALDWDLLNHPVVERVVPQVADKVAGRYRTVVTTDDVHQEASIWVAMHGELVREYLTDEHFGPRALFTRLYSRMVDAVRPLAARADQSVSYESLTEEDPDE